MRHLFLGLLLAGASLTPNAFAADAPPFVWQGGISGGRSIEIKGINGWIHAEPALGGSVEVSARRVGRKQDPNDVKIQVLEHGDGVTICAVYPDAKDGQPNECKPGKAGRMNTRDNDVQVEFTVKVPAGVNLVARNVNGEVKAEGMRADVTAHTVNGDVNVSTTGLAMADTVNGSIHATLGQNWTDDLEFKSVNGSIDVTLPSGASTELDAQTVNGGVYSDFQMAIRGTLSPHRVNATIGGGGRRLKVHTVNGAIRIRQAGKTA
ncbi:MAG: DUF4097 family beta strand repeat-containing protein [Bryobacteraceae bacterium]